MNGKIDYNYDDALLGKTVATEPMPWITHVSTPELGDYKRQVALDLLVTGKTYGVNIDFDYTFPRTDGSFMVTVSGNYAAVFRIVADQWGSNEQWWTMQNFVGAMLGDSDRRRRWYRGEPDTNLDVSEFDWFQCDDCGGIDPIEITTHEGGVVEGGSWSNNPDSGSYVCRRCWDGYIGKTRREHFTDAEINRAHDQATMTLGV